MHQAYIDIIIIAYGFINMYDKCFAEDMYWDQVLLISNTLKCDDS